MEEAVTESIIREANQQGTNAQNDFSAEKENDHGDRIVNVETFVNQEKGKQ